MRVVAQRAHGVFEEFAARVFARVGALHQSETRGIETGVIVAVIELRLVADRFNLQRGRDQQRGGQRNLRDHQHACDDIHQAAAIAAATLFHDLSRIPARTDQRGDQPGNDGGEEGNRERKDEHAAVDRELPPIGRRERSRFDDVIEHGDSPEGNERAADRAEDGHDQALGQHLPNEPPTGRAERTANGQFLGPQCRAAKLHVHHVHARDQQNDDDRAEHGPDDLAQLHAGESIDQRLYAGRGEILIRLRIILRDVTRDRDHLRVRLVERHARLQPSHDRRRATVRTEEKFAAWCWRPFIIERRPKFFRSRELKARRHHADDRRRFAVDGDALSDNVRIGVEITAPDFVPENRGLG